MKFKIGLFIYIEEECIEKFRISQEKNTAEQTRIYEGAKQPLQTILSVRHDKDNINININITASGTRGPDGGYPPDIRDVTDGICKHIITENNYIY